MLVKPLQQCLVMVLSHLSFIGQQKIAFVVFPYLFNQYLFLKLIQVIFNIFWFGDVLAKPVDRLVSFQQSNIEDPAILAVRSLQRLISKVEEIDGKAKNGVEVRVLAEHRNKFELRMHLGNLVDEVFEEVIDGALPLGKVHALGSEFADCLGDSIQGLCLVVFV